MRSPSGTPSEKTNDTRSKGGPAAAADSGEAPGSNWRMAQTLRGFFGGGGGGGCFSVAPPFPFSAFTAAAAAAACCSSSTLSLTLHARSSDLHPGPVRPCACVMAPKARTAGGSPTLAAAAAAAAAVVGD